jgi:transcriptional regulator with XRE-family HTH domain
MPISSPHAKDPVLIAFGAAIRKVRRAKGISQEELAHLCEIDRSYMGSIELGDQNTWILHMAKIAGALEVTIAHLMVIANL